MTGYGLVLDFAFDGAHGVDAFLRIDDTGGIVTVFISRGIKCHIAAFDVAAGIAKSAVLHVAGNDARRMRTAGDEFSVLFKKRTLEVEIHFHGRPLVRVPAITAV